MSSPKSIKHAAAALIMLAAAAVLPALLAPSASAASYNEDTVSQFVAMVDTESQRYGTGPVQVYVADLGDDDVIAQTEYGAITLNAAWAMMSPSEFYANMADDFATGYHPAGCGSIQSVAIHEMGHVIDQRTGAVARWVVGQQANAGQIGYDLHGYAFENGYINPGEAVAVSFQAVECGSATPTEYSIYNLLIS